MEAPDIDAEEQSRCFDWLDAYAKSQHNCGVKEFFLSQAEGVYYVGFRALAGNRCNLSHYACEYVRFTPEEVKSMSAGVSPAYVTIEKLDAALATLGR